MASNRAHLLLLSPREAGPPETDTQRELQLTTCSRSTRRSGKPRSNPSLITGSIPRASSCDWGITGTRPRLRNEAAGTARADTRPEKPAGTLAIATNPHYDPHATTRRPS